jgi:microcin C transport system permease protein
MAWFELHPLTVKKLRRFRAIRRGYWSFVALVVMLGISLFGELFVNSRALVVKHEGKWYFPTYGAFHPGTDFGLPYSYETNYRELKRTFEKTPGENWVLMPLIPYNARENHYQDGIFPPTPPSWADRHLLGTDDTGRDIFARLFFGFRIAFSFALLLVMIEFAIGIAVGCTMGYKGGAVDLAGQRGIEIWSLLPTIYIIIIVASLTQPTFWSLLAIMGALTWHSITYYMRTATLKERTRDYVSAARVVGASHWRVVFHHVLPNTIATLITFLPFSIAGGMTLLTALDFLGFGLPPPTPSWGELLKQGMASLTTAPWILASTFSAMVLILVLVTFVGEAIREAFDPKRYTVYE